MAEQKLDNHLKPIYNSSVPIQDVAWKTSQKQWTIETGGKRGSGKFMLAAHDDDDDDLHLFSNTYEFLLCLFWIPNITFISCK